MTSQRPSPSPKSKPKIPKSQIQKVKGDFCLWALTEVFWANHHTTPFTELSILITNIVFNCQKGCNLLFCTAIPSYKYNKGWPTVYIWQDIRGSNVSCSIENPSTINLSWTNSSRLFLVTFVISFSMMLASFWCSLIFDFWNCSSKLLI